MKPKEFLFKQKGYCYKGLYNKGCYKRDYKNGKGGIIYLSNTQLRIISKNDGEYIIPSNTIKKLNLHKVTALVGEKARPRISIQTDTDELYTFTTANLQKLYNLLYKVIANMPDGGDVHVGSRSVFDPKWICWIIWIVVVVFAAIIYVGIMGIQG